MLVHKYPTLVLAMVAFAMLFLDVNFVRVGCLSGISDSEFVFFKEAVTSFPGHENSLKNRKR